jgi:preprotein translocase subunit SecG
MGKLIIEGLTWAVAALFFGLLIIIAFGLTYEDVQAIFAFLEAL